MSDEAGGDCQPDGDISIPIYTGEIWVDAKLFFKVFKNIFYIFTIWIIKVGDQFYLPMAT